MGRPQDPYIFGYASSYRKLNQKLFEGLMMLKLMMIRKVSHSLDRSYLQPFFKDNWTLFSVMDFRPLKMETTTPTYSTVSKQSNYHQFLYRSNYDWYHVNHENDTNIFHFEFWSDWGPMGLIQVGVGNDGIFKEKWFNLIFYANNLAWSVKVDFIPEKLLN